MAKPLSTTSDTAVTEGGARATAVSALVAAATCLFADHGPDGVSLRAVASEAGVNYGLIHQYVGSKDDLLRLVCRSVSERAAAQVSADVDLDSTVDRMFGIGPSDYVTMLTWTVLQGRDPVELLGRSPALTAVADRLDRGQAPLTRADRAQRTEALPTDLPAAEGPRIASRPLL